MPGMRFPCVIIVTPPQFMYIPGRIYKVDRSLRACHKYLRFCRTARRVIRWKETILKFRHISTETKNLVEQYTKSQGVKKAFLVESALLHHLQALKDL